MVDRDLWSGRSDPSWERGRFQAIPWRGIEEWKRPDVDNTFADGTGMNTMPHRLRNLAFAAVLPVALCANRPAAAVETEAARSLVQAATDDMLASYAGKTLSRDDSHVAMQGLVDRYCDMGVESQQILGHYWTRATPAQQQEFQGLLERYFVGAVGGMIDGVSANQRITVQGAERDGDRVVVHSLVSSPNKPASMVHWVVMDGTAGRPVITDVSTEGITLVTTLSADFKAVVRAVGRLDGLVDSLRQKVAGHAADRSPPQGPAPVPTLYAK